MSSCSARNAFCSGSGLSHASRAAARHSRVGQLARLVVGGAVDHLVPRRHRGGRDRRLEAEHGLERLGCRRRGARSCRPSSFLAPPTPSPSDRQRIAARARLLQHVVAGRSLRARSPGRWRAGDGRSRRAARRARRRWTGGWARACGCGRCRTSSSTCRAIRARARRRAASTISAISSVVAARSHASRPITDAAERVVRDVRERLHRRRRLRRDRVVLRPRRPTPRHVLAREGGGQLLDEAQEIGDVVADVVARPARCRARSCP